MTSTSFLILLDQYLVKFRNAAHLLVETRRLGEPEKAVEAALLRDLAAYTWAVRNRGLLRPATQPSQAQQAAEIHARLSIVETLVGLRLGALPTPTKVELGADSPPTHALFERLVSAESRLFHLYGSAPLN